MDKSNLLNIVICIVLISAILIIISLEKSKIVMEKFYQANESAQPQANESAQPQANESAQPQANESAQPQANESAQPPVKVTNDDINEDQLKAMCQNIGSGIEAELKTLKLSLLDLNHHVKPSFWFNEHFCIYRMERVMSINPNIALQNPTDDDYYYPLSDVILFKNYDSFLKGEIGNNANNSANNTNNTTLIVPSPSFDIEEVSSNNLVEKANNVIPQTITLGDNRIDNYNQPGVDGLKIMVKGGKKPLAYPPNPSAVIQGSNGENLYVWEPIPPNNYVCLGCVCTVSVRPTIPNINECPIRCVPSSCAHEIALTLSDDIRLPSIVLPYHLFGVSNGKFFKGTTDMPNQAGINIKSHDIQDVCDNTELDANDKPVTIKLHYRSTDISGKSNPPYELSSNSFNSVKGYFNKEFEAFLINKPELQLNDYPNNPPNPILKPSGKRYLINSLSKVSDKVELFLSLNKRALAYNQLSCTEMYQTLSNMIGSHKISLKIFNKDYHLVLENVEIANMYVFDPNKIDWTKTFVDPELIKEEGKVDKVARGGYQYRDDPFKFNKDMDSFLKISNNMEGVEMSAQGPSY
jgi:hypothetical protein